MSKTLGIIGGLGTETSCSFCLNINTQVKKTQETQPHLIMDNVPISNTALNTIAHGGRSSEVEELLTNSVKRLNDSKADVIVIPCNTVHVSIDRLRELSSAPILSIIEETAKECEKRRLRKVGVLGSSLTIKEGLYSKELQKCSIEVVIPNNTEQEFVSNCIIRIIHFNTTKEDKEKILEIIANLQAQGAEAIILGCTDLFLIVSSNDVSLPLIDSTKVLENAAVKWLTLK